VTARDEEIGGHELERASAYASSFDCEFCVRVDDPRYRGPKVDEEGNWLADWEIVEHYQQRRAAHLERDFTTAKSLRSHLTDRVHYWVQDKRGKDRQEALDAGLQGVDATVEGWQRRHDQRAMPERLKQPTQPVEVGV
jgi:hypothetical protein